MMTAGQVSKGRKIMIRFRLHTPQEFRLVGRPVEEAFVYLATTNPHVDVPICFEGPQQLVREIRENLIGSYGERGRRIEESTSGYDLNNAMHGMTMAAFEPEFVEGVEILRDGTNE